MNDAVGLLETHGLTPAMVAIDVMCKAADISVKQVELNDLYGVCVEITGEIADVNVAIEASNRVAQVMDGRPLTHSLARIHPDAVRAVDSPKEFNPLIQQDVVFKNEPYNEASPSIGEKTGTKECQLSQTENYALGFIETQGFVAVIEAIDTACKTANVEVVTKEKLGGGYITIVIKGQLSAVSSAVEAGKAKVEGLGKLIAAHVIAHPSPSVLNLLPQI